ncbi:hypothetical protein GA8_01415 [Geobacillus sp. A8]|nr:hypothetical protein GA8_01415 [Geobacillus sp. A8]
MTARWERELEAIARGKGNPQQFLANIRRQTQQLVAEIKQSEQVYKAPNLTNLTCPECGALLKERKTKDGRMLVCSNLQCRYRRRRDPKLSNRRCPQCHRRMEMHEGKAGLYFQCRPCNIVEKADETKRIAAKGSERALLKKYSASNESFGVSLGELFKQALSQKEE